MASENKISAHVEEIGESDYAVSISVSGHTIKGDEPISFGGGNFGPAPYDMLLAALGECTAMSVRWYAKQQNWPLEKVEVRLSHQKINASELSETADKNGKVDLFEKQIIIQGESLTPEQHKKLVDVAANCPVQRTLESDVVIQTLS